MYKDLELEIPLTKTTYMLHIAPTYICDIYVTYM